MKKIFSRLITAAICLIGFYMSSCSDDNDSFVLRNTDEMAFSYANSSQILTVCTDGDWSVEALDASGAPIEWIVLSPAEGKGDGTTRQEVTVTVKRNSDAARLGYVHLLAAGKDLTMSVSQEEGSLIFGNSYLNGSLYKGVALEDAAIVLAYTRATIGATADFQFAVSGAGAAGLSLSNQQVTFDSEEGNLQFPITGIPTTLGAVNITISSNGQEIATLNGNVEERTNADPIGTVYFEEHFDKMLWGGDYVAQQVGIKAPTTNSSTMPDAATAECTIGADGSSSLVGTMNATFVESRGFTGWTGDKVYERPGYIKMGTASAIGKVITPALTAIEGKVNLKVSFKSSCWGEGAATEIWVTALNAGTVRVKGVPGLVLYEWNSYYVEVDGATADTKIQFTSPDGVTKGRFFLDDVVIEKIK